MKIDSLVRVSAASAAVLLLLTGCGAADSGAKGGTGSSSAADSNPYNLITPGEVLASTSGDQPPFASVDDKGNPSGFVMDINKEVFKRLDLKVTYKLSPVPAGIQGLTSEQYDMVANGLGVTDERKKSIDFAKGLYWSETALLTKKDSPASSLDDFGGKKVAVVTGSVQVDYMKKLPGAVETDFDGQNAAVSALNSGTVDAFIVGGPDAEEYLHQFPDLKIAASSPVDHATTVAFQKGNTAFEDAYNEQVGDLIADGTFQKIYTSYFSEAPQAQLIEIWPALKDMK